MKKHLLRVDVKKGDQMLTTLWVRLRDDVPPEEILRAEQILNELTDHRFHFSVEEDKVK